MVREGSRRRAVGAFLAVTITWLVLGAGHAEAQLLPIGPKPPPTTTTTTAPPSSSTTSSSAARGSDAPPASDAGMPATLRAKVDSVRRTPANRTDVLVDALAPLGQYGLDETQRAVVGFGRFPVAGRAQWSDDWWMPRHTDARWRVHEGLDIFATHGTPVRAPVDGTVVVGNGGLGGLSVTVRQADGTRWYLAHLSAIPDGMADGVEVTTGQVVGFVGTSGDAAGTPPHVHLQIHPRGGNPIPPKPVIDKFVADALGQVPQLLDAYARAHQQAGPSPELAALPALPSLTTADALLWVSAANPAGGTLRLARAAAEDAAARIDWSSR